MTEETQLKIKIANVEYPVLPLVGRQLRHVMPALMRWRKVAIDIAEMKPENYDDLYEIIYYGAIQSVNKALTPSKLLDIPGIGFTELTTAVGIITQATGLFKPAKEGDTTKGEAKTEAPTGNP